MLSKRIVACLDVRDGKLAKSIKFVDTKDIGDPVEKARAYYEDGLDELVFYDITASNENRGIMLDVVEKVAAEVFIPLSVGGGIRSVDDATKLRLAGAEKINVNSAAVKDPDLIARCSHAIGAQSVVLSMDVLRVTPSAAIPSGYEIVINGGRTPVGMRRHRVGEAGRTARRGGARRQFHRRRRHARGIRDSPHAQDRGRRRHSRHCVRRRRQARTPLRSAHGRTRRRGARRLHGPLRRIHRAGSEGAPAKPRREGPHAAAPSRRS